MLGGYCSTWSITCTTPSSASRLSITNAPNPVGLPLWIKDQKLGCIIGFPEHDNKPDPNSAQSGTLWQRLDYKLFHSSRPLVWTLPEFWCKIKSKCVINWEQTLFKVPCLNIARAGWMTTHKVWKPHLRMEKTGERGMHIKVRSSTAHIERGWDIECGLGYYQLRLHSHVPGTEDVQDRRLPHGDAIVCSWGRKEVLESPTLVCNILCNLNHLHRQIRAKSPQGRYGKFSQSKFMGREKYIIFNFQGTTTRFK